MRALAALLLALAAAPALAQKIAPGLWEHAVTMKGNPQQDAAFAKMQQQLAAMPPEQRQRMEQMMAQRGLGAGAKPNAVRVCISPAMAQRQELPQHDGGRCKNDSVQRSGNKVAFKFSCSGEPPTRGEGEFTFAGDKAYSGRTVVDTVRKGQPERLEMQIEGRFVAADCGDIKPRY